MSDSSASLHNFRDVALLCPAIKPGSIFRSGSPDRCTPAELARLEALHIKTWVDLREAREIQKSSSWLNAYASRRHAGFKVSSYPTDVLFGAPCCGLGIICRALGKCCLQGRSAGIVHIMQQTILSGNAADLRKFYISMLENADFIRAVHLVADPSNHPVAFNCTAGKDRTGTLACVILGALGIERELIVADYAKTTEVQPALIEMTRKDLGDDKALLDAMMPVLVSPPEAMQALLTHIDNEYGGFDPYLDSIGLNREKRETLRAAVLR